ncbi:tRNA (guanosine(46)-N7)-methyltransferase TrmB [Nocardioides sp. HDW12B]|uniref:tRNA (guanosine(46)-N7)-methyltransferase TrmB n=1 Tax=Nocardioides sp. HDW12B TaxID=2714939 RepID=UPI00140BEFB1|nr:tRNA (guanosine(46)-N7)-methyltransferase TrmB [Nocardioides sp. HDW12B]QIK67568.1 tRNA (guanosine(46)-N7)-methyltransferase TrmB [Nocardioides sp. HDW12B]
MSDPARPGAGVTEDGRPLQVVTSYARRGSRLNGPQQKAWDAAADRWVLPTDAVAHETWNQRRWFGREAPLVVEVGSGDGESVAALAATRPEQDVLAVEVWRPGVAGTLRRLLAADVPNVRLVMLDATWLLEHRLPPGSLAEVWTFFPDPWPKKRHHKRRLVGPRFAGVVASRLRAGGLWRLATDWPDYADHAEQTLATVPELVGGRTERWAERPVTRFERRGLDAGRPPVDLTYRRV